MAEFKKDISVTVHPIMMNILYLKRHALLAMFLLHIKIIVTHEHVNDGGGNAIS